MSSDLPFVSSQNVFPLIVGDRDVAIFIPLQGIVLTLKSLSSRLTEEIIDNDNRSRASRSQISHLGDRGRITLLFGQIRAIDIGGVTISSG